MVIFFLARDVTDLPSRNHLLWIQSEDNLVCVAGEAQGQATRLTIFVMN
jgi:hypothetical protein